MEKRRLGANLILGALLFVGVVHTVLALFVFETGLADVGALVIGAVLVVLVAVNS